jgi:hypothetical protein
MSPHVTSNGRMASNTSPNINAGDSDFSDAWLRMPGLGSSLYDQQRSLLGSDYQSSLPLAEESDSPVGPHHGDYDEEEGADAEGSPLPFDLRLDDAKEGGDVEIGDDGAYEVNGDGEEAEGELVLDEEPFGESDAGDHDADLSDPIGPSGEVLAMMCAIDARKARWLTFLPDTATHTKSRVKEVVRNLLQAIVDASSPDAFYEAWLKFFELPSFIFALNSRGGLQ